MSTRLRSRLDDRQIRHVIRRDIQTCQPITNYFENPRDYLFHLRARTWIIFARRALAMRWIVESCFWSVSHNNMSTSQNGDTLPLYSIHTHTHTHKYTCIQDIRYAHKSGYIPSFRSCDTRIELRPLHSMIKPRREYLFHSAFHTYYSRQREKRRARSALRVN